MLASKFFRARTAKRLQSQCCLGWRHRPETFQHRSGITGSNFYCRGLSSTFFLATRSRRCGRSLSRSACLALARFLASLLLFFFLARSRDARCLLGWLFGLLGWLFGLLGWLFGLLFFSGFGPARLRTTPFRALCSWSYWGRRGSFSFDRFAFHCFVSFRA